MEISNIGNSNIPALKLEGSNPVTAVSMPSKNAVSATDAKSIKDVGSAESKLNSDELRIISDKLQRMFNSDLIFSVDEKSGEHVIKVVDKSTKEVIRQIPSEEAIQIKESIDRFQKGLLVNLKT